MGHAGEARARARRTDMGRATSSGPRFEFGFSFSSELINVYSIQFLADLWKIIVNVVDVKNSEIKFVRFTKMLSICWCS